MPPKKTVEERYQKKTQLEHILCRPDTYVGAIEKQTDYFWIWDKRKKDMIAKDVTYVPGLYKIFDEIIVNAADNFTRDPEGMTFIKVTINQEEGFIEVENNGKTLPVEMHKEHKMYVPELVFGHLLTSDNYDDDEKKVTGGRNGYGAKLTNIFSTRFQIECCDSERGQKYVQVWENNMQSKGKANITNHKGSSSSTKITFYPDLARLGMKKLDNDIVGLMCKRVYDLAGTTSKKCKVWLDGEQLPVSDFKDYVNLFCDSDDQTVAYERSSDRWEVAVTVSEGQFEQHSFVNSICTTKGGTHVTHVTDQFVDAVLQKVNKQNKKGMDVKGHQVKSHLKVFVNCLIENPSFDSQTKETMTLKQVKFGSKYEASDGMVNRVLKTGIVDLVLEWAKAKESIELGKKIGGSAKKTSRLLGVPKLEDANWAGTKQSGECSLILTEGDSAKSLAVAGLSVVGRDKYGVFPLRGKLLNIREANFASTMNNQEISNIIKILGLQTKKEYRSVESLRYGSVIIMADQDYDGSHIKGLLINLIQHWWPSLFKMTGFIKEFVTPIVKVSKKDESLQFFTLVEYEQWKAGTSDFKSWNAKYYKGLGTSTTAEAKEYFQNLDLHSLEFSYETAEDDECIDLAFNKKRADDRKEWINGCADDAFVDHNAAQLSYKDFVQNELVHFARYDVMRSIPCAVDGLKPTQRKVVHCCFRRNLKSDVKVAQLTGYISEHAAYHHGETSLQGTIIGMAQKFVGSNNINLLVPSGQFGTRIMGGKDHASARYIYCRLESIARTIFHPDDFKCLEYQYEEGQKIEPKWFIPVIPLVLVNGADGIGTGWSTFLPNYNPRDIVANLKKFIRSQPMSEMCPWYRGFKGSIVRTGQGYDVIGVVDKIDSATLEISELPIRRWTQDYKEFMQTLLEAQKIEDFKEYHTESNVHFVVKVSEAQMSALEKEGFEKSLKMRTSFTTNNMVFFDESGKIKRYETEREILEDFAKLRLQFYKNRKAYLVSKLKREYAILSSKARFIRMVIEEKLKVKNRKRDDIIQDLRKHEFKTMEEITQGVEEEEDQAAENEVKVTQGSRGFDYLLGMPIWNLTYERVEDAEKKMKEKARELENLMEKAVEEMWETDLNAVLRELDLMEVEDAQLGREGEKAQLRARRLEQRAAAEAHKKKMKSMGVAPLMQSKSNDWLQLMQERQLAKTHAAFPGLFNDVLGKPMGTAASPPKRSAGDGNADETSAAKRVKKESGPTDFLSPGTTS